MRQSFEVRGGPLEGETFGLDVERHEEVEFAVDGVTHFYRAQWTEYPAVTVTTSGCITSVEEPDPG